MKSNNLNNGMFQQFKSPNIDPNAFAGLTSSTRGDMFCRLCGKPIMQHMQSEVRSQLHEECAGLLAQKELQRKQDEAAKKQAKKSEEELEKEFNKGKNFSDLEKLFNKKDK